ncbi:MAG: ribosome-recycling factor [Minisyncoccales bacterium]
MYKKIIKNIKPELEKVVEYVEDELKKVRTNRVSPSLVEDIKVKCYGKEMTIKELAAISCPEARQILIQPWESSYLEPIEKAIAKSNLNLNPIVEQESIRITVPAMTKEYRKELDHLLSEKQEQARQTIRKWRQKAWSEIQEAFRNDNISEDQKYKAKDELQDLADQYKSKVKELINKKREQIKK